MKLFGQTYRTIVVLFAIARTKSSKKSSEVPPTSGRSSARKRAQSSSVRSSQRSSKKTKSASASSGTPDLRPESPPSVQEETSTPRNIIDLEEPQEDLEIAAEDGAEDIDAEDIDAEDGNTEEGNAEEGNTEEGNAEEDNAEEESIIEEEPPMKFMSTWRAVAGKEHLPGVQSREYEQWELRMSLLERWRDELLGDLRPKEFRVVRFEAVASYDRCKASDERPQTLRRSSDLYTVIDVLKSWHQRWPRKQLSLRVTLYLEEKKKEEVVTTQGQQATRPGRRIATQAQLVALPEILQAEASSGNTMPAIADRWTCHNLSCRNKGKTCWRDQPPGAADNHHHHYPVPGELFRDWSREITDGKSTVDQPSQRIVVKLVSWKERDRSKNNVVMAQTNPPAGTASSTTEQLLQTILIRELRSLRHPETPRRPQQLPPHCQSSPLTSSKEPGEIIADFIDWLKPRPTWNSPQQHKDLDDIKSKFANKSWTLDAIKDSTMMTDTRWEAFGLDTGLLVRLRPEISLYKQQRPNSSSSNGSNIY